mgnify:CR=1 FL=1
MPWRALPRGQENGLQGHECKPPGPALSRSSSSSEKGREVERLCRISGTSLAQGTVIGQIQEDTSVSPRAHPQSQVCRGFQAALLRQQEAKIGLCRISGTSLAHKPCSELAQKTRLQASRHSTEQQASSCLQQPYLGCSSGTDKAVPYLWDASCARLDSQGGTTLLP